VAGIDSPASLSWRLELIFTGPAVLSAPFSVSGVAGMSNENE